MNIIFFVFVVIVITDDFTDIYFSVTFRRENNVITYFHFNGKSEQSTRTIRDVIFLTPSDKSLCIFL